MTQIVLTRSQVREIDRRAVEDCGMASVVLMENAGRGCAEVLAGLGAAGPVVVAAGRGNNAGDGFVIARHLDNCGLRVRVLLFAEAGGLAGDAAVNYQILRHTDVRLEHFPHFTDHDAPRLEAALAGAEWIVDALLGTGAAGDPRPPLDAVIARLNACPVKKLAVDLPSGLNCDTGEAGQPTFRADHTCTFVAAKPGLLMGHAHPHVGVVHVVDIGVPRRLIAEVLA